MGDSFPCVYCASSFRLSNYRVHLNLCRIDYVGDMCICPYNGSHLLPLPERELHDASCPDKDLYLRLKAEVDVMGERGLEMVDYGEGGEELSSTNPDPGRWLRGTATNSKTAYEADSGMATPFSKSKKSVRIVEEEEEEIPASAVASASSMTSESAREKLLEKSENRAMGQIKELQKLVNLASPDKKKKVVSESDIVNNIVVAAKDVDETTVLTEETGSAKDSVLLYDIDDNLDF